MRIAHLSTRFPPAPGGVERHVFEVTRRLAQRGHSVSAMTSDLYTEFPWRALDPAIPRTERRDGVEVRRLPVWTLPGELHYPFFRGMQRALHSASPEIVHVHTYGTNHAAQARRFSRRTGTPYLISAHYHPIWSIYGGWLRHRIRSFYDRRLAQPILSDAARVIVQSREEERLMLEAGLRLPRIELVPPGYTPMAVGMDPGIFCRKFGIRGPFALFVGRLASNKGLLELLEAFATLRSQRPDAELALVGQDGGMQQPVSEKIRRLGLDGSVHLTGFVTDDAMVADAYRTARLTVLPSEYEAFGLVLLESLAQGTPVVASRVGGIPEFIEDRKAGILVKPLDVSALSEALRDLWDDEASLRRMGEYGRDVVAPRYSWDRVADRLESIYREVIAG